MNYKRFKEGDLLYSDHDNEYAVFMEYDSSKSWITVLMSDGEKAQVQGCWWKVVSCK